MRVPSLRGRLFKQGLALSDAEPVLLVADDEPGFSEAYSLGNQRVRAYDELQRAVRERRR